MIVDISVVCRNVGCSQNIMAAGLPFNCLKSHMFKNIYKCFFVWALMSQPLFNTRWHLAYMKLQTSLFSYVKLLRIYKHTARQQEGLWIVLQNLCEKFVWTFWYIFLLLKLHFTIGIHSNWLNPGQPPLLFSISKKTKKLFIAIFQACWCERHYEDIIWVDTQNIFTALFPKTKTVLTSFSRNTQCCLDDHKLGKRFVPHTQAQD